MSRHVAFLISFVALSSGCDGPGERSLLSGPGEASPVILAAALQAPVRALPVADQRELQAEPTAAAPKAPTLPVVDKWAVPLPRCHRRGRRRFCDGPRRVPAAVGAGARRAAALGLGTHRAAAELIRAEPRDEWLSEVEELGVAPPPEQLVWPVETGFFGRGVGFTREDDRSTEHRGVDVMADDGELVVAVADGLVAYADNTVRGYGNMLILLHGGGEVSMYAHLEGIHVAPGQVVRAGAPVAVVGHSGLARGPHLHMEWREGGEQADPMLRFAERRRRRRPRAD